MPLITGTTALLAGGAIAGAAGSRSRTRLLARESKSFVAHRDGPVRPDTTRRRLCGLKLRSKLRLTMQTVDERVFTVFSINRIIIS